MEKANETLVDIALVVLINLVRILIKAFARSIYLNLLLFLPTKMLHSVRRWISYVLFGMQAIGLFLKHDIDNCGHVGLLMNSRHN